MQQFKQTSNVTASCTSNQNVDVSQSGISRPEDMDIKKDVDEPLNFTMHIRVIYIMHVFVLT
jgi:hypothetical protein